MRRRTDSQTLKTDLPKALHASSWHFFSIMGLMAALLLGAMYFMANDRKSDIREIRIRLANIEQHLTK